MSPLRFWAFCLVYIILPWPRFDQRNIDRLIGKAWLTLILRSGLVWRLVDCNRRFHKLGIVSIWKLWFIMGPPAFIPLQSSPSDHPSEMKHGIKLTHVVDGLVGPRTPIMDPNLVPALL